MAVKTTLESVIPSQDGSHDSWDTVVTAKDIATLYQTGFLRLDPDRQRGRDAVTRKLILDNNKIERWAEQLINGEAYLGQLSWNFRTEDSKVEYNTGDRTLTIASGAATIPDSYHRHMAILKAVDSRNRGSAFDLERKFSVKIYHVPASEENRIFYAMNQEGQKADPSRSKWLHQVGMTRLAGELVKQCRHLNDNVDVVRDRLSRRNPRLCAFNTLSSAFENQWNEVDPDEQGALQGEVDYMVKFWDKLVSVRPELGKLDLLRRQKIRETSLVDSALAIHAYVAIARKMREQGVGLAALEKLAGKVTVGGKLVDILSRENDVWEKAGVLVPKTKRDGTRALNLRNARQSREAMLDVLAGIVGVDLKGVAAA
jgi:hypothetical protein